jgi:four helix bundle protein
MANKLEELPIYGYTLDFCAAVTAILERPTLVNDRELWGQIDEANDSIPSNMQEGFEQGTDASLVRYLYYSKGSLKEVLVRLRRARAKRYITQEELDPLIASGEALGKMLGGWIRYLAVSDFRDRGRHRALSKNPRKRPRNR